MARRGCACEDALDLVAARGGRHAARMLRLGKTKITDWGPRDWIFHLKEEEDLFFPMLENLAPSEVIHTLYYQHRLIRDALSRGMPLDPELLRDHAHLEDKWAATLQERYGF